VQFAAKILVMPIVYATAINEITKAAFSECVYLREAAQDWRLQLANADRVHECYRQTDRQTTDVQTTTHSEREREFTFAKQHNADKKMTSCFAEVTTSIILDSCHGFCRCDYTTILLS